MAKPNASIQDLEFDEKSQEEAEAKKLISPTNIQMNKPPVKKDIEAEATLRIRDNQAKLTIHSENPILSQPDLNQEKNKNEDVPEIKL